MKLFSPERANALIPRIEPLVNELLAKRRDLAIKLLALDAVVHEESSPRSARLARSSSPFPPPRFGELKSEIVRLIHRIESCGCTVKDIDLGLIDFPASMDGEPVFLCWKVGEASVAFWHPIDAGFRERRAL